MSLDNFLEGMSKNFTRSQTFDPDKRLRDLDIVDKIRLRDSQSDRNTSVPSRLTTLFDSPSFLNFYEQS